jgi:hypothetical protein
MTPDALLCAVNNVDWYRAIFAAHGLAGEVRDGVFFCRAVVPPYYSNAVAFLPEDAERQLRLIRELANELPGSFSVKDCFARLPLETLGFRELFAAQWIRRDPAPPDGAASPWRRVTRTDELAAWEAAWRTMGSPTDQPVFLPELLNNPALAIFAARDGCETIAVCAANRSEKTVGLSNFFTREDADDDSLLTSAIGELSRFAPGLPIVGYEHGEALARCTRAGFRAVGPLRIWLLDKT